MAGEPVKLDPGSARALVRAWILEQNPNANPELKLELQEVEHPELWASLGAQLFAKTRESFVFLPTHFLIKARRVYPAGSFGPPFSWCLADLDRDGAMDFVHTALYGSGLIRATVSAWISSSEGFAAHEASASLLGNREIVLSCESAGRVWLSAREPGGAEAGGAPVRFGRLLLDEGDPPGLRIEVDPAAPEDIRKDIWD